ncbi:hypothetical protein LUZ63_015929 [Rhynchospora breviuscula]|uniref:Histidine-containing phosphotransfer protein n=1 Tax=Rhynchospora breviuscula TaxID=2022672 RepID=A0A9Q0CE02_9POAL|nr:hypothetical protein LUZ63_015929 [Rhynchospora breviuscula]
MPPRALSLAERRTMQRDNDRLLGALAQEGLLNHSTYQEFKEVVEDLGIAHGFVIQFFTTADEPINEMRKILSERSAVIDQDKMALQLSHIREPSDLFGMTKVSRACQAIRVAYQANDKERCLTCIRELKNDIAYVKPRLHQLISYERNIRDAGGRI